MSLKVRQGVFETNSSSTHSICIAKYVELTIPESLNFSLGKFGWDYRILDSVHKKASYLYTALVCNDREDDVNCIINLLLDKGIEVTAEEIIWKYNKYTNSKGEECTYKILVPDGYVDHQNELGEFLDAICEDESVLMRYLFSPFSFIITGNDNDDHDVSINVDYPHNVYYKGN